MHNPLRSEAEMFRVVVIVGIAAAPVIAIGLLTEPVYAAILLALEVGIGDRAAVAHLTRLRAPHRGRRRGRTRPTHRRRRQSDRRRPRSWTSSPLEGSAARSSSSFQPCPAHGSSIWPTTSIGRSRRPRRLGRSLEAMSSASSPAARSGPPRPQRRDRGRATEFAADELVISTHPPERSSGSSAGWSSEPSARSRCRSRT